MTSDLEQKENILLEFLLNSKSNIQDLEDKEKILSKLGEKHPKLTSGEIVICGFLKERLSNNEIATKRSTIVNTVKAAKNRTKKKINLPKEVKLDSYIRSI